MASTSDIKKGLCIKLNSDIYKVIEFLHVKPGKGPAFVRTKIKSVTTGKVIDNTFSQPANDEYVAIYCLANATNVTTTTPVGDALGGVDMQQGMIIYGDFITVSVGTGTVIAYIK